MQSYLIRGNRRIENQIIEGSQFESTEIDRGVHPNAVIPWTAAFSKDDCSGLWNKCPGQRQSLEPNREITWHRCSRRWARGHSNESSV